MTIEIDWEDIDLDDEIELREREMDELGELITRLIAVRDEYDELTPFKDGRCCLCGGAFEYATSVSSVPDDDATLINHDLDLWACDECIEEASSDLIEFLRNIE